jgi:plastocyanin
MRRSNTIALLVFFIVLIGPMWILVATLRQRPHTPTQASQPRETLFHTILGVLTDDDRTVVPPPSDLRATNTLPGQVALQWTTIDSQLVTGYRVYRDGEFLGVVSTAAFGDANTVDGRTYRYSVIALSSSNIPSTSTDIEVRVHTPVAVVPVVPKPTTNTSSPKNTNTTPATPPDDEEETPVTPVTNTNTANTNTGTGSNQNTNTATHTPTTVTMHVTQNGVVGSSTLTIVAGDSVQFILDTTNNEVQIRFSPAASSASITLDEEHDRRTVTFSTAGTYTFSSQDDPAVHGTILVTSL